MTDIAAGTVPATKDDEALVASALRDRSTFGVLYERYRLPVYRYLRARGADDDVALDLMATTFERALSSLHRFRSRDGGFGAWLFRIARNARVDEHRRSSRVTGLDNALSVAAPQRDVDAWIDLRVRVARLPEPTRDAIALRYAAGLSAREIASIIGKPPDAVQKLIERGIKSLREDLRDDVR
jgi:RNA polymerase sigma-70 factor (ECF subfamily)